MQRRRRHWLPGCGEGQRGDCAALQSSRGRGAHCSQQTTQRQPCTIRLSGWREKRVENEARAETGFCLSAVSFFESRFGVGGDFLFQSGIDNTSTL